jgi:hypothetical protein
MCINLNPCGGMKMSKAIGRKSSKSQTKGDHTSSLKDGNLNVLVGAKPLVSYRNYVSHCLSECLDPKVNVVIQSQGKSTYTALRLAESTAKPNVGGYCYVAREMALRTVEMEGRDKEDGKPRTFQMPHLLIIQTYTKG